MNIQIGDLYKAKASPSEYALVTGIRIIGNKKKTIFIKFFYCTNIDKESNGLDDEAMIDTFEQLFETNEHSDR